MSTTPVIYPDSIQIPLSEGNHLIALPDSMLTIYTEQVHTIKGEPLPFASLSNSWISLLVVICFLLVASSYHAANHFLQTLFSDIFEENDRRNFATKSTLGALRLKIAFLVMTFVMQGLALYVVFEKFSGQHLNQLTSLLSIGCFSLFFLFLFFIEYLCCNFLGYVFSDRNNTGLWLGSLTSITILRGLSLFIPVLIAIYQPIPLKFFIIITLSLYLITRILFIFKGIKIFFSDFYSLIYGVLYLCTFEIAPLLVIYKGLFLLFRFVELKLF